MSFIVLTDEMERVLGVLASEERHIFPLDARSVMRQLEDAELCELTDDLSRSTNLIQDPNNWKEGHQAIVLKLDWEDRVKILRKRS